MVPTLDLLHRLLSLDWRRQGAVARELPSESGTVWYADFTPRPAPAREPPSKAAARERPTLVLLHGLGAASTAFYTLIPHLRQTFRVVAPDLPGHGRSRLPPTRRFLTFSELSRAIERLVEQVAPGGAYLVGNSLGGWLAAKLAARRPELALGMALLNPGGPALRTEDWNDFAELMRAADVGAYFARVFHRPPFGARLFRHDVRRVLTAPVVSDFLAAIGPDDFLGEQEVARIRCPSVLVWGQRDRFLPEGCRAWYLAKVPQLRYEPLPECGHCPQLEEPKRTARILVELARPRFSRRAPPRALPAYCPARACGCDRVP